MDNYVITSEDRDPQSGAACTATLTVDALPEWLGQTYTRVMAFLESHNSFPVGPPFAKYRRRADGLFDVTAGFPVQNPVHGDGTVEAVLLPGGAAATTMHVGSYDDMAPGYQAIADWIDAKKAAPAGDPWEVYLSDPGTQPTAAHRRTQIVQPYVAA